MKPSMPWLGELCALAAALTWSISVILFKRSEQGASPLAMNLFKNVAALLLLTVTMLVMGIGVDLGRAPAEWAALAISGVLGIAVADTLVFVALRRLGAGLLAVVGCAYAPVMVSLSVVWLGEPLPAALLLGGLLVVAGLVLATTAGVGKGRKPDRDLGGGVVAGIVGISAMGVGVVVVKPLLEAGSLVEITTLRLAAGVLGQLVWIAVRPREREALAILRPSPAWRTLLPASVLGSYVAMLFWLGGFKWANATVASLLNQLSSVFTMLLAWLVLRERLDARRVLGAAMAIAGASLVLWSTAEPRPPSISRANVSCRRTARCVYAQSSARPAAATFAGDWLRRDDSQRRWRHDAPRACQCQDGVGARTHAAALSGAVGRSA